MLDAMHINIDEETMRIKDCTKIASEAIREQLIKCFEDSLRKVSTKSNIMAVFAASGICPLEPGIPLESKFCMPPAAITRNTGKVSNMYLNSIEGLAFLYHYKTGNELSEDCLNLDIINLMNTIWSEKKIEVGIPLSPKPEFFFGFNKL